MQLLEDSVEERMEKALSDSDKTEAESKDADAEDNNKAGNSLIVWEPCYILSATLSALKHECSFSLLCLAVSSMLLFFSLLLLS
jgi:hypothetical protein